MIKERIVSLVLVLILLVGLLPLVSAQYLPPVKEVIQDVITALEDILGPISAVLLNTSEFDDFLFAKILVVLLLFIVILTVLKRVEFFERTRGTAFLVALIISILSMRYVSKDGFFAGILLPYGTLGIAITSFLPFLIYFWFVHQSVQGGFARRIAWFLYGIIFLFVWGSRPAGEISAASNWIYTLGFLAVAISFFFDRSVHSYFGVQELARFRRRADVGRIARLQAEYNNLQGVESREAALRRGNIMDELRRLHGEIPD